MLDTSPAAAPTHWKQTVLVLREWAEGRANQPLLVQLLLARAPDNRSYDATVDVTGYDGHPLDCDCMACLVVVNTRFEGGDGDNDE